MITKFDPILSKLREQDDIDIEGVGGLEETLIAHTENINNLSTEIQELKKKIHYGFGMNDNSFAPMNDETDSLDNHVTPNERFVGGLGPIFTYDPVELNICFISSMDLHNATYEAICETFEPNEGGYVERTGRLMQIVKPRLKIRLHWNPFIIKILNYISRTRDAEGNWSAWEADLTNFEEGMQFDITFKNDLAY